MTFQLGTVRFLVEEVLPRIPSRGRVLCLGRHKISGPLEDLAGYLATRGYELRPGENGRVTSRELFTALGFSASEDLDASPADGAIHIHDLNRPLPDRLSGAFDLVFEMGTIEHVFDVRSTFANIVKALAVGGAACHLSPLDFINHGFYNMSLTLFHDVYRINGFSLPEFWLLEFPLKWWKVPEAPYRRVDFTPHPIADKPAKGFFLMTACLACKREERAGFTVPTQAIYDPDWTAPDPTEAPA